MKVETGWNEMLAAFKMTSIHTHAAATSHPKGGSSQRSQEQQLCYRDVVYCVCGLHGSTRPGFPAVAHSNHPTS